MLLMKIFKKKNEKIVAVCDAELIGKVLREGELVLNLEKYADFYNGEQADEESVERELLTATSINLVGDKATGIAKRMKLVRDSDIKRIQKVPHVQVYRI
ncbi:MAG: hypothetical protein Sv326_1247 [Candidatus Fermentimicrarchaeum limneticum]|uniref:DUF424 domain-containing protein n=1 Tax=Fermentimicrarchaeum limneticum TaxID=2795018 RepID=A0A7D6BPG3_FERL1|nr:MAG: hypothetical protein Sv326_1247 [Candidatus Fermentimicrarchaeum limneticum]